LTKLTGSHQDLPPGTSSSLPARRLILTVLFLHQLASMLNDAFDALLDAYVMIGTSLPSFEAFDSLFCSHSHVQQALADIYEDILDFHCRATTFFKRKS